MGRRTVVTTLMLGLVVLIIMMCNVVSANDKKIALMKNSATAASSIPSQVHIALTRNPREMIVSFHTESYDKDVLGMAKVIFSKNENFNDFQVAHVGSVSTTYGDSAKTGYEHHVLLVDLEYSTKYYYKCGFTKSSDIESEVYYFHTRTDPKETESKQVSVVMYGDQGTTNSAYVIARTKHFVNSFFDKSDSKHKNMFVYHLGDIGYANDFAGAQYQFIWTKYMKMLSDFMPHAPYMVCVGNHEKGPKNHPYDEFEIPFRAYNYRFYMPGRNESSIGHNMWHSFEYGPITFVAIDTETNFPGAHFAKYDKDFHGDQLKWLDETLSKVDRKKTPWLIVVGHRPIYSSTHEFSDEKGEPIGEAKTLQEAFEDLIQKYKTDIFMVGHVHSYGMFFFPIIQF